MTIILAILAGLVGLFIVLIAIPIVVSFRLDRVDKMDGQVNIRWLFGLVRFRIPIPGEAKTERKPEVAEAVAPDKHRKPERDRGSANFLRVLKRSAFRRRVFRYCKSMFQAMHARDLSLRMRIGLGDPADTGRLWAFVGPVAAMAMNIRGAVVNIEPEFIDPVFELHSRGRFRLIPLQFLVLTIGFVLSPSTLRAWRDARHGSA